MENISQLTGGSKYSKDTYIGYIKEKNGGMKVIPGDVDNKIIEKRDKILGHLNLVLSGGKRLKEKNIKKYFQALGGKYIRNDICISGDNSNCKNGRNVAIGGAHKLLKLVAKKKLPVDQALETFKGSAPKLYEKLETKIKGGYKAYNYDSDGGSSSSSSTGGVNYTCEGFEPIERLLDKNATAMVVNGVFKQYLKKYSDNPTEYTKIFQKNTNELINYYRNNPERRRAILVDSRERRNKKCNIPNYAFPLYYAAIQVEYDHRLYKQTNCKGEEGMKRCDKRLNNMYLAWSNNLKFQKNKEENKDYRLENTIDILAKLACVDKADDSKRDGFSTQNVANHIEFMSKVNKSFDPNEEDTVDDLSTVVSESGGRDGYDRDGGREDYDRDGGREYYDRDGGREDYDRDGGREDYDKYDRDGGYSSEYSSRGGDQAALKKKFNKCYNKVIEYIEGDREIENDKRPIKSLSHDDLVALVSNGIGANRKVCEGYDGKEKAFIKHIKEDDYDSSEEGGYDRYDIDGGRRRRRSRERRKPKKVDDEDDEDYKLPKPRRRRSPPPEEEDHEGGYYDRYDSPRRRYYPNSMHGGELGRFRNEIGRGEFTLRDQILNLEI